MNTKSELEIIELDGDDLFEYEALAMCSCDQLTQAAFLDAQSNFGANDVVTGLETSLASFFSLDREQQQIYSSSLVQPALQRGQPRVKRALVVGGGDGLVAQEILWQESVEQVDVVEVRKPVTDTFSKQEFGVELNKGALQDARVKIINGLGEDYIDGNKQTYDLIVLDLVCEPLLKNTKFYEQLADRLEPGGTITAQNTFPVGRADEFESKIIDVFRQAGLHCDAKKHRNKSMGSVVAARKDNNKGCK